MKKDIIAYVTASAMNSVRDEDVKKFNILNIAFGHVKPDASLDVDHIKDLSCVKHMKEINPELKVLLSVGGGAVHGFSNACLTKAGRERYIDTTIEFLRKWDLDGVDLDWEVPTRPELNIDARPEDKYTYTMLCQWFREKLDYYGKLDGKRYGMSMAAAAELYVLDTMEVEKIVNILDYIHLMTYDLRFQHMAFTMDPGGTLPTGHHTNLYPMKDDPTGISIERTVNMFLNVGIPAEKLLIGAAFYAKDWKNVRNENNGLNQPASIPESHCCSYQVVKERYMTDFSLGFKEYWDDDAKAPYLFNGYSFVSYDNPRSMREKVKYVKERGLRGIMFWVYSGDPTGELLDAIYTEVEKD